MELQALLVLCGLGVIVIAVLLLMGLFSATGTSYEEAIAQQRKAATELLALAENKNKPKKNVKKANKKLAKKEKNKEAAVTSSELESEAPAESGVEDDPAPPVKAHVEFCPPVVVDLPRDTPPNVKIRKRGKDPKIKPILLNKEDPSCVSDPSSMPVPADTAITNNFEELHPKDEFELLHSTFATDKTTEKIEEVVEKKENKVPKPAKISKAAVKMVPPADTKESKDEGSRERRNSSELPKEPRKAKKVEKKSPAEEPVEAGHDEVVPPLNAPQPTELTTEKLLKQALVTAPAPVVPVPSPPAGKNKKKKTEPNVLSLMAGDSSGVNVGELVRVVRDAVLSRTEIQILTDALLNKHHDPLPEHSEWTEGPNDPVQKLKKQLADKEKALADEVEASQALQAKLKELRGTLNAERARAASANSAAVAAAAAGARAAEQERARSEQVAASVRAELHTLQSRLQRLLEENHALAQDKIMMQSKLVAEGEAQAQRVQMEMHIQRLSESEATLVQQLNALQVELNGHALEAGQARMELGAARDSVIMAQQHAAELVQQLQDSNRAYTELEQHTKQERRQLQEKFAELQNEMQKITNHVQIAESNSDKLKEEAEKLKMEGDKLKHEAEKQKQQLSSEISSLGEQLALRETELVELKQMKVVPTHNGLPASKENEQQKAAELVKVESLVQALRVELEAAQLSNREQREQLHALSDQLRTYQDKNNELRTKNWKVMEALQSAEKALQMKSASALPAQESLLEAVAKAQEAQYKEMADLLRAVCPSAAPKAVNGHDWLQAFAENLKKELQKDEIVQQEVKVVPVTAPISDDRLNDLKGQNEHLQSLVDKYKRIIDDTEGVLCRLQQHVTTEEERWALQLADKQRELDDLRHRTVLQEPLAFAYSCMERSLPTIVEEMQKKIDALQNDLQQEKGANQNHSFADAERLTQERLLMDLSNKHMDVHNGPMQVGLDEK